MYGVYVAMDGVWIAAVIIIDGKFIVTLHHCHESVAAMRYQKKKKKKLIY